jgi:hypothetical protein
VLTELQTLLAALSQESFHLLIRGSSKEKEFVEVTLARKLSLAKRESRVLCQLSR